MLNNMLISKAHKPGSFNHLLNNMIMDIGKHFMMGLSAPMSINLRTKRFNPSCSRLPQATQCISLSIIAKFQLLDK